MPDEVTPCPGGCRELADPEKAVVRLLPHCTDEFLNHLKLTLIGRVQRERQGTRPSGEVGKNVVSRV